MVEHVFHGSAVWKSTLKEGREVQSRVSDGSTGCPEDESNFETYGNSGIGGAMRISFGLLRAGMCWFNYM